MQELLLHDPGKLLILGDFNAHWDHANTTEANEFKGILNSHDLQQHVTQGTHIKEHTLDW